jgi:hypothetical protein
MDEKDSHAGMPAAGEREAEVENAQPQAMPDDWDAPTTGTGPSGVPPNHIVIGTGGPLYDDPIVGSVVGEDWGRIPGAEPDVEQVAVRILDEDAMI